MGKHVIFTAEMTCFGASCGVFYSPVVAGAAVQDRESPTQGTQDSLVLEKYVNTKSRRFHPCPIFFLPGLALWAACSLHRSRSPAARVLLSRWQAVPLLEISIAAEKAYMDGHADQDKKRPGGKLPPGLKKEPEASCHQVLKKNRWPAGTGSFCYLLSAFAGGINSPCLRRAVRVLQERAP